ncbi:AAA family ATPase [Nesterenkonia haasae]|uniref:AAA family ATPase n=1 Tax=Nesterenkonia haasae TaxID=2587813 RepID=UPI0013919DE3|nr:AAA family ATPase [Nesterenkonia haasae]
MSTAYDAEKLAKLLPDEYFGLYHKERRDALDVHRRRSGNPSLPETYRDNLDELALVSTLLKHAGIEIEAKDLLISSESMQRRIEQARLNEEIASQRRRKEARDALAAERAAEHPLPDRQSLPEFIEAHAGTAETWLIDDLWPTGGTVLLAAPAKAGKTTMMANLLRSLVDGAPFLDRYGVDEPGGGVLLIDTEMNPARISRWLQRQKIHHPDEITPVSLRGQLAGFNIMEPETRTRWARHLEGHRVVILDNLRPVLDALGMDENHEAGRFLQAWHEFIREMGADETLVVTHTGHNNERARGDSAITAWPDALWTLARESPNELHSPRFFRAYGRDVEQPERALDYDHDTGKLTLGLGGRRDAKLNATAEAVHAFLRSSPGTSLRGIRQSVNGNNEVISAAVKSGVDQGLIRQEKRQGKGGGQIFYMADYVEPGTELDTPQNKPAQPAQTGSGTGTG